MSEFLGRCQDVILHIYGLVSTFCFLVLLEEQGQPLQAWLHARRERRSPTNSRHIDSVYNCFLNRSQGGALCLIFSCLA